MVIMAACALADESPAEGKSGVEGVITVSPAQPGPTRLGAAESIPLPNATFGVENEKGEVASFTTDDQGRFRTLVPPGHYKIALKGKRSSIGHFGPFDVDVVAGKITKVQWQCDSGMR